MNKTIARLIAIPLLSVIVLFSMELNAQITSWSTTTSLPEVRKFASSIVWNGRIYVTGGDAGDIVIGTNTVYRATLNADGTISSWATFTMPVYKAANGSVVWNDRLYVLGGYNDWGSDTRSVRFAPINADGSLGSWSVTTDMPAARIGLSAAVWNGRIYATGGASGVVITARNSLYIGAIASDGTIPSWTSTTLPEARAYHAALAIKGRLYIIGGGTGEWADTNATNTVYFATINADGSLGSWSTTTPLPSARNRHGAFFDDAFSQIYIIGGKDADQNTTSTVWYATVNADGTLGAWTTTTSLPSARKDMAVAVNPLDKRAYIIGGTTSTDAVVNTVWYTTDPPLPITLASFSGMVINGNNVQLEWMTISEINNYGFYVERRGELEEQFTEIPNSFVQGAGTTLKPQYYSFIDNTITETGFYYYRLKQVDNDGLIHYSQPISINVTTLSVRELATMEFRLHQNYPNPFNSTTTILFSLSSKSFVSLKIFDILGRDVATLVNEELSSGKHAKQWNAEGLPSGVYIYRLQVGSFTETKKLLLLR